MYAANVILNPMNELEPYVDETSGVGHACMLTCFANHGSKGTVQPLKTEENETPSTMATMAMDNERKPT